MNNIINAKDSLNTVNSASGIVRALFTGFMFISAYVIIVIASTDDMQLLRFSPIKLPLLDTEINLKGFYTWMPWLYIIIHAHLLLLVTFLDNKLTHFKNILRTIDSSERTHLREQLHVLSITQYLSGRHTGLLGISISTLFWVSLVFLPILLLLAMQIDFLPAQEIEIVWNQRFSILIDTLFIFLWG